MPQAEMLDDLLDRRAMSVDGVIELAVPATSWCGGCWPASGPTTTRRSSGKPIAEFEVQTAPLLELLRRAGQARSASTAWARPTRFSPACGRRWIVSTRPRGGRQHATRSAHDGRGPLDERRLAPILSIPGRSSRPGDVHVQGIRVVNLRSDREIAAMRRAGLVV